MKTINEIDRLIAQVEKELASIDSKRSLLLEKLEGLKAEKDSIEQISLQAIDDFEKAPVTNKSPVAEKVSLFRELFRGRSASTAPHLRATCSEGLSFILHS